MGWMETGIAKTRAVASDARADLAESTSDLLSAKSLLKVASSSEDLVQRFGSSWLGRQQLVAPLVHAAAVQTQALRSRAQANVDELTAKQESARTRMSMAEKSQNAMTRIAEETDKIIGN